MTTLAQYDAARAALAAATRVDQVLPLREQMEHIKLHAKHVQDRELMADATEIQIRAETKLGFLLGEAKKAGLLKASRPKKPDPEKPTEPEGFTLKEIGVTHKLSADAQHKASITEQALEAMIQGVRNRIISGKAKIIEEVDVGERKKEHRANRERLLAGLQCALPSKKYGVIYADPEWRFEPYSRDTGMDRAADNHYPTSAVEEIARRPVASIAADDCILFMWATVPMLQQALYVMEAWGFACIDTPRVDALKDMLLVAVEDYMEHNGLPTEASHWVNQARALIDAKSKGRYVSHACWTKDKVGTGYWFRNAHELLLVGTRGSIPAPAPGTQWPSTIEGRVGKHSAKPDRFYELIEEYFPTLPKIELNARQARKEWDSWGNEAPVYEHVDEYPTVNAAIYDPSTGEVIENESGEERSSLVGTPVPQPVTQNQTEDDGLGIPDFLKRVPVPVASSVNAISATGRGDGT